MAATLLSKRKAGAGPLVLDWDALLGDNEPPQLVVIESAKSKPKVMMLGEDKELHKDFYLQGLSDRELADKISRSESMLGKNPSIFPDGGARLRVLLNNQLAERERRKLLKADGKLANATLLAHDKPIRIDAINDLTSRGAPPSVPASRSIFASHFHGKLDDNKGPTKSFTNEMSTLNRYANKRENRPLVASSTQKIGLSSRQTLFKSPSNLSDHTNDSSNREPDKGVSGYLEKKKMARRVQPMRSCKLNNIHHSLKSASAAQTARAKRVGGELAQAERELWLKEKEELIAAHKAELEAMKEKSWAEGYKQGQDELKGLQQRPF